MGTSKYRRLAPETNKCRRKRDVNTECLYILTVGLWISEALCSAVNSLLVLTSTAIVFTAQHRSSFSTSTCPRNPVPPVTKTVPSLNVSVTLVPIWTDVSVVTGVFSLQLNEYRRCLWTRVLRIRLENWNGTRWSYRRIYGQWEPDAYSLLNVSFQTFKAVFYVHYIKI